MIFWQLFYTFLKIGIFTFGGGLGMVALIQDEVVVRRGWLTATEFTDIIAVSEMTPGPVGINTATYAGYTAVLHAGYDTSLAVVGSLIASFAVILLPASMMMIVLRFLLQHSENRDVKNILAALRVVIIGVIASAALILVGPNSFGAPGFNRQFVVSVAIFVVVAALAVMPRSVSLSVAGKKITVSRPSPIILILLSGVVGLIAYGL